MRIIGKQLVVALASAVRPLRKPGADTVRQMPGLPVRKPAAAAALPACCSWRNEMTRSPSACIFRVRSVIGMPGSPNTVSMPFSFSASMTSWKPSIVSSAFTPPSPLAGFSFVEAVPGLRTADMHVSLEWNVSRCGLPHAVGAGGRGIIERISVRPNRRAAH